MDICHAQHLASQNCHPLRCLLITMPFYLFSLFPFPFFFFRHTKGQKCLLDMRTYYVVGFASDQLHLKPRDLARAAAEISTPPFIKPSPKIHRLRSRSIAGLSAGMERNSSVQYSTFGRVNIACVSIVLVQRAFSAYPSLL